MKLRVCRAALAAAIRRLVVEPDLRQSLVRASIMPPAGVDWADVAPRYEDEYRAAIAAVA